MEPISMVAVSEAMERLDSTRRCQPCLKHQYRPQLVFPVAPAREVLLPLLPDRPRMEISVPLEPSCIKQSFRPVAQRAAQPCVQRNAEPLLRTLDKVPGHVAV